MDHTTQTTQTTHTHILLKKSSREKKEKKNIVLVAYLSSPFLNQSHYSIWQAKSVSHIKHFSLDTLH